MGFGREVNNGVHILGADCIFHSISVADVATNERVPVGIAFSHVLQILKSSGIGQLIVNDNAIVGVFVEHEPNEVAADEPSATCDHDILHVEVPFVSK